MLKDEEHVIEMGNNGGGGGGGGGGEYKVMAVGIHTIALY